MKKPILVRKQADGIVNYRDISQGRPSAGALARRLFADPTAGKWQKINAGLNLAGKGAAAVLAANDAAQRLHGGNITAPLTIGQTYASLDPSSMSGQTAQEQQQREIQRRKNKQRDRKINALTDLRINVGDTITNPQRVQRQLQTHTESVRQPPAGLPAETPVPASGLPAGATPPGMGGTNFPHPYQAQWEATGATGRAPPTFTGARGPTGPPPVAQPPAATATQPAAATTIQPTQPAATAAPATSMTPTDAAELLPPPPTGQAATASAPINPTVAGRMLGDVSPHPTSPTVPTGNQPQYSGAMPPPQPAAPVAVKPPVPVDNGLTPHQGTMPVLMPQQRTQEVPPLTHEQQRQQAGVGQHVETPYTPQNTVNPFATETGQKPGHPYNTGEYTPTIKPHGLSGEYDYRNNAMPANFGNVSWRSSESSLGDDSNFNWDEIRNAFVSQVLDEFGDMLHKADPHVAGAVVMRAFLEKMLRK